VTILTIYKEFGKPQKRLVKSSKELIDYVKKYNHVSNCYKSVYAFREIVKGSYRWLPNYDSAIIDKIFIDFDGKNAFVNMKVLHKKLLEDSIHHNVIFSGKGYHIYVYTERDEKIENKREALRRCSMKLAPDQDTQVAGDISRISRMPYTWHMGARRYCIPITKYDIFKGEEYIKETALSAEGHPVCYYGEKLISLKKYDAPEIIDDEGIEYKTVTDVPEGNLPRCVETAMNAEKPGYWQRFIYFTYMRECEINMKSAIKLVKPRWTWSKGYKLKHSYNEEQQPQRIWRNKLRCPSRVKIHNVGLCEGCQRCGR
jgi:hypothetical protein